MTMEMLAPFPIKNLAAAVAHGRRVMHAKEGLSESGLMALPLGRISLALAEKPSVLSSMLHARHLEKNDAQACKAIALAFEQLGAQGVEIAAWRDNMGARKETPIESVPLVYAVKVPVDEALAVITVQGGKIEIDFPTDYEPGFDERQVKPDAKRQTLKSSPRIALLLREMGNDYATEQLNITSSP